MGIAQTLVSIEVGGLRDASASPPASSRPAACPRAPASGGRGRRAPGGSGSGSGRARAAISASRPAQLGGERAGVLGLGRGTSTRIVSRSSVGRPGRRARADACGEQRVALALELLALAPSRPARRRAGRARPRRPAPGSPRAWASTMPSRRRDEAIWRSRWSISSIMAHRPLPAPVVPRHRSGRLTCRCRSAAHAGRARRRGRGRRSVIARPSRRGASAGTPLVRRSSSEVELAVVGAVRAAEPSSLEPSMTICWVSCCDAACCSNCERGGVQLLAPRARPCGRRPAGGWGRSGARRSAAGSGWRSASAGPGS